MVLLDQQELDRIILIVCGTSHRLVEAWQPNESRLLLRIKIFGHKSHNEESDQIWVRPEANHIALHFFQNFHGLFIIQTSYNSEGEIGIRWKSQSIGLLRAMDLIQLIIMSLEGGLGDQKPILK
jgi:hypothetical protein